VVPYAKSGSNGAGIWEAVENLRSINKVRRGRQESNRLYERWLQTAPQRDHAAEPAAFCLDLKLGIDTASAASIALWDRVQLPEQFRRPTTGPSHLHCGIRNAANASRKTGHEVFLSTQPSSNHPSRPRGCRWGAAPALKSFTRLWCRVAFPGFQPVSAHVRLRGHIVTNRLLSRSTQMSWIFVRTPHDWHIDCHLRSGSASPKAGTSRSLPGKLIPFDSCHLQIKVRDSGKGVATIHLVINDLVSLTQENSSMHQPRRPIASSRLLPGNV